MTEPLAVPQRRRRAATSGAFWLLAPSLVFLLAFTYWPIADTLLQAVTEQQFGRGRQWGLGNFARLFADPHFAVAAGNSLVYALGTILPSLALALAFALALRDSAPVERAAAHGGGDAAADPAGRGGGAVRVHLPAGRRAAGLVPGEARHIRHQLAGRSVLALGSIIAITVWKNTGYYMLFFLAGLAGIPRGIPRGGEDRRRRRLGARSAASPCRCWGRRPVSSASSRC